MKSDIHPIVLNLAAQAQGPNDLARAVAAIGPEGFIGWLKAEQGSHAFAISQLSVRPRRIPPAPELVREWTRGLGASLTPSDFRDFGKALADVGFLYELKTLANTLDSWLSATTPRDQAAKTGQLADFIHNEPMQKYLARRRELRMDLRDEHDIGFPYWVMDDILARACWEVLYALMTGRAKVTCPGCGRAFLPHRLGQGYCTETCYRRAYFADLEKRPDRREYQRLYKRRTRLKARGGDEKEIRRLTRRIEELKRSSEGRGK